MTNLIIREERAEDFYETELMTMRSFWNKFWPGCTEHLLVRIIRESADYLPKLSRIEELDGKIVGAVYYTRAWIDDGTAKREVAMLGPLAVEPTMEGNGIGGVLLRETLRLAKDSGVPGIILAGEPGYYPKFGFQPCAGYGITDGEGKSYDAYMCYPLTSAFAGCRGHFVESADFAKLADEGLLQKISREFPAYRKVKVQDGFMQIGAQHLGVLESVRDGSYNVRYWELLIACRLAPGFDAGAAGMLAAGSDVLFYWDHKGGESKITRLVKNLLAL